MSDKFGALLHITSLPSKQNIGTFGQKAFEFVDFLCDCGISYWQILPLNLTDKNNSPYQSPSAFAGNTSLIDFEVLYKDGFIRSKDFGFVRNVSRKVANYQLAKSESDIILGKAFENAKINLKEDEEYQNFVAENSDWLDNFSYFMAAKESNLFREVHCWDRFKIYSKEVVDEILDSYSERVEYFKFTQFLFFKQWFKLKNYANQKNINIIGDLPFYVSGDSADIWANSKMFKIDENLIPSSVSGVPPDAFSEDGQLWGNPVYNFDELEKTDYSWFIKRFEHTFKMFDTVRLDHFRAFESYYEIPFGSENAKNGKWVKSCGMKLFNILKQKLGDLDIIAEDLGIITDEVRNLVTETGFPNMKVAQFGFDGNYSNEHFPLNYCENSVAYLGTHDNNTTRGFLKSAPIYVLDNVKRAIHGITGVSDVDKLIKFLASSKSKLAIFTMQDFMNLDESARMNIPSTIENNWSWRLSAYYRTERLKNRIKDNLKMNV